MLQILIDAKKEILSLRRTNELYLAEITGFEKALHLLNSIPPPVHQYSMSMDIISEIDIEIATLQSK